MWSQKAKSEFDNSHGDGCSCLKCKNRINIGPKAIEKAKGKKCNYCKAYNGHYAGCERPRTRIFNLFK